MRCLGKYKAYKQPYKSTSSPFGQSPKKKDLFSSDDQSLIPFNLRDLFWHVALCCVYLTMVKISKGKWSCIDHSVCCKFNHIIYFKSYHMYVIMSQFKQLLLFSIKVELVIRRVKLSR